MSDSKHKGVEEARKQLPALLAEAEGGRSTIITRHGRAIAAIVPIAGMTAGKRQKSLLALAGTGQGLWDSTKALRKLREEWER
jgi:antitoxin (DNA-binding transcriptional repressor) of toxin-antitoxin stability system